MKFLAFPLVILCLSLDACSSEFGDAGDLGQLDVITPRFAAAISSQPAEARDCSLVLYGDSILNGAYVEQDRFRRHARNPAAEIEARRPAWTVDDRTQPGQSLAKLARTFRNDARNARVVVIGSGIAEGWAGETVLRNLPWMVYTVRGEGRIPVLTGYSRQLPSAFMSPEKLAGRDRVDHEVEELAGDMKVEFADIGAAAPVSLADEVHPTADYSLRLTDRLVAALDRVAPECSRASAKTSAADAAG
ncbi:SGNH/GDSL hydrolase family protein [Variovorax sp. J22P168]|uniref:SGNH/GDSL hydrolase family protein n=1 Tax=Variovorax jilinensis TaxID=3053513 RepID=UPI002578F5CF|nr:SGNH/GDSL hydrolase family protein [Variovorax sp. J22P168]MDM0013900.1 SGNH/GDSL hydrolase family protein [Variovorax sp. J22P168]